jgi:alkylated DNA nucleotide flippase Atl1
VDVRETRLRSVLSGDQRYRVPLYQRPYSWTDKQLERLWTDLVEVADELQRHPDAMHFTGSLVLDVATVGPGGSKFLVVDGQQRLTTLSILLCAIRDHIAEHEPDAPAKSRQIHDRYLVDEYQSGDDRLKLLPTQVDRDAYRAIIDGATSEGSSRITTAYRFFRLNLDRADDPDDDADIDRILEAALGALAFVSITSRGDDNVYRIFESLNNTGMPLSQGDLLRNYVFMRLGARGEEAYDGWWRPMQERLSADDLVALFWMDIVATQSEVKQGDMYSAQRLRLDALSSDEVFTEITRFAGLSHLLALMRDPASSERFGRQVHDALARLTAWGATTADPLILQLLARTESGDMTIAELEASLAAIESFLVRRLLVNASSTGLSRILLRAPSDMRTDMPVADALLLYLSTGRKFFASDDQIREAVATKPLYYMGKPNQKKLLLQWLEETYANKEPVDLSAATIEHVLPQTLTPFWRDELVHDAATDESAESIHEALVHTLGNLTLTGYNSELSNSDFPRKRELLSESGIRMNAEIARHESWGRPEIAARGQDLAERIIRRWVPPVQVSDVVDSGVTWALVRDAVQAVPPGSWTTYGDLAALASTYPQPVAGFLARNTPDGAWRVLEAGGVVAPGFSWGSRTEFGTTSAREVLEREGVRFDGDGRAHADQRLGALGLAERLGIELDLGRETDAPDDGPDRDPLFERFIAQLTEAQPASIVHGVLDLLERWRRLGGWLQFGVQDETSCFLMFRAEDPTANNIWPFSIYPRSGTVEVVFQYLKDRPPYDSLDLREELRRRLNRVDGIDLSEDRITRRPSFRLTVLESSHDRDEIAEVLRMFTERVDGN